ncbi:50S ribosomal protein L6 [Candidatus Curtissbacteria bacterium RIFCSPHIGHO2_01_FULL_41_11]|uniref:Large ribosomal subunit protein uL6 n=1 Tax=Candidatus Curtissbacteria bacterium RIFCSPHIGHO2_01_FULL_41_11 TaxID=1797711 RepID=A0A1F5G3F9_9BACT|nr:MAG: 50S ribosomal protein L6 [Candidatus Curtissbacteria bacterium RIFCSPHIGHO2_01_FULL_41_11]
MSKIGKQPVQIPQGVTVKVEDLTVNVSGPKGNISFQIRPEIAVMVENQTVKISRKSENKFAKALHGLTRSVISNMVKGVTDGHQKMLELVGVGYKAAKQGNDLVLNVGYSHPVVIISTNGVEFDTKDNKIIVSGIDKIAVGEMAAKIRKVRPPEPYKGKGIRYSDEIVRKKAGKAVKAVGA